MKFVNRHGKESSRAVRNHNQNEATAPDFGASTAAPQTDVAPAFGCRGSKLREPVRCIALHSTAGTKPRDWRAFLAHAEAAKNEAVAGSQRIPFPLPAFFQGRFAKLLTRVNFLHGRPEKEVDTTDGHQQKLGWCF
jgi:hypothetical protein